jgi:hypothetical protein
LAKVEFFAHYWRYPQQNFKVSESEQKELLAIIGLRPDVIEKK